MVSLKDDSVDVQGLRPEMFFALGLADAAFASLGLECVITAALDGDHNSGSLHAQGLAVDVHNVGIAVDLKMVILSKLKRLERYGFDVVSEAAGQTGKTTAPHFHIEYQPKPGERQTIFG